MLVPITAGTGPQCGCSKAAVTAALHQERLSCRPSSSTGNACPQCAAALEMPVPTRPGGFGRAEHSVQCWKLLSFPPRGPVQPAATVVGADVLTRKTSDGRPSRLHAPPPFVVMQYSCCVDVFVPIFSIACISVMDSLWRMH